MQVKNTLIGLSIISSSFLYGGLNFGGSNEGCEGGTGKSFQQQINNYGGDLENAITVGPIPKDMKDVYISLKSDKDVDIRLYYNVPLCQDQIQILFYSHHLSYLA